MTRLVVIVGFLVAFAAGLVVGSAWQQPVAGANTPAPGATTGPTTRRGRGPEGWLAQQLELTPDQVKQLESIWSDTARRGNRDHMQKRMQIRKDRDDAIVQLMADSPQRDAYQKILDEYAARNEKLEAEWRSAFQQAVENTKAMLSPPQREKYEALLARQDWGPDRDRGDRGERGPSGRGPRPATGPSTQPAIGGAR
jgi:uncharacterized membrane protein